MADEELDLESFIQKVLNEEFPDADVRPGTPFYEFFVKALNLILFEIWSRYRAATSWLYLKNFNDMSEESMDSLASNFLVKRTPQDKYQGIVNVYYTIAPDQVLVTPLTAFFNKNGAKFYARDFYKFEKNEIESNFSSSKNMFFISIPVVAEDTGEAYKTEIDEIVRAEGLSPTTFDLIGNDIFTVPSGSSVKETNEDLYTKIIRSLATRELVQNDSIFTVIKDKYAVDSLYSYGLGSPEVTRDLVDNVHTGTAVDIYFKTSTYKQNWFLRKYNGTSFSEIINIDSFDTYMRKEMSAEGKVEYRVLKINLNDTDYFDVYKDGTSLSGKRIYKVVDIQDSSGVSLPIGSRFFKTILPGPTEITGKYGQGKFNEAANFISVIKGDKNYLGSKEDILEIWINRDTIPVTEIKVVLDIFDTHLDVQTNIIDENPVLHSSYLVFRYLYGFVYITVRKISGTLDINTIKSKINEYLYKLEPGEPIEAAEIFRIISEVSPKALVEVPFSQFSAKIEKKDGRWLIITDESIITPPNKLIQFRLGDFQVI